MMVINDIDSILYRNAEGELQVRLQDAQHQDIPSWPGQWAQEEIDVVCSRGLAERIAPLTGMNYKRLSSFLRSGRYVVVKPAQGYGKGLDREKILICNPETGSFFTMVISKDWRSVDGVPQIGVLHLIPFRPWNESHWMDKRTEAARRVMTSGQFSRWQDSLRQAKSDPNAPIKTVLHKKDVAMAMVYLADGRSMNIGILPVEITLMPRRDIASSAVFWEWVDLRIREQRGHETKKYGVDVNADFVLENIEAIRIRSRREPVELDFILWSRV
jgi:hypothetical protein